MEREKIKKLAYENFTIEDLEEIKKSYEVSHGRYDRAELKKAIDEQKPFYLSDKFIIGYQPATGEFISHKDEKIKIERMVKAVIIEDIREEEEVIPEKQGDYFAIIGKVEWEEYPDKFNPILGDLRVGEIFLPPHSAVFNFLNPTAKDEKQKIVSCLEGININIYSPDNYIDNCFHEIGHLFWRDCVTYDEKMKFREHFKYLKPSALYEYEWERENEEEVFCTLYKWYLKSMLLNPSFYNILEHEEPDGLKLLQNVMDRKAKDQIVEDIWEMSKDSVIDYLSPKLDRTTGKRIVKKGLLDEIRDVELPERVLNDIDRFQGGTTYVRLGKAIVPVHNKKIDWERV